MYYAWVNNLFVVYLHKNKIMQFKNIKELTESYNDSNLNLIYSLPDNEIPVFGLFERTPFKNKIIQCVYGIITEDKERLYVGSTTSIVKRVQKHRALLRKNNHHSKYLQRCFNKNINLYYFIIEITENLEDCELFWIRRLQPVFNSTQDTQSIFRTEQFIEKYTKPAAEKMRKSIICYNMDGTVYSEYKSLSEAAEAHKTSRSNIRLSCISNTRTCKGFVFRKNKEPFNYSLPKTGTQIKSTQDKILALTSKSVIRNDGTIYSSVSAAERENGFPHNTLAPWIKLKKPRNNYFFEYLNNKND